jgi:AcrR family transcriptional regulator
MSTSRRKKVPYHHGDLRPELLRAAGELLEDQGLGGVVWREVARRARVSHTAPYRHFPDRESLLAALATQGYEQFAVELAGKSSRDMGAAYVRFAIGHPNLFRLMFGGQLRFDAYPELRGAAAGAYEALRGAFRANPAIADPDTAAAAAWSLVHGLSHLLLDGHFRQAAAKDPEKFVQRVLGAVRFAAGAQRSA